MIIINNGDGFPPPRSLSKKPGVDKGPQPLMFNPALTTCASERMKTQRFSFFAGFAARRPAAAGQFRPVSRGGTSCFMQGKTRKNSKKWRSATFSTASVETVVRLHAFLFADLFYYNDLILYGYLVLRRNLPFGCAADIRSALGGCDGVALRRGKAQAYPALEIRI